MKKLLVLSSLLLATCGTTAAHAVECFPGDQVFVSLSEKYGEAPVSFGKLPGGQLVMWANYETQTFSVTITDNEGVTCLMTSGENFTQVEDLPPIKPNL